MNPQSSFRFESNESPHMHYLTCLKCNTESDGMLFSNTACEFDHDCYDLPESSSVQLHEDNDVVHLFSSKYYSHNKGSDNGQTKANGIK